jgi:GNAT superfamily N-acetyltransferase
VSQSAELHYYCRPVRERPPLLPVEFLAVPEFLADEPACKQLWELVSTQFRTRSKFLAIWAGVRFVCLHRAADGSADGFLLVTAPVNWQIDYVVVRPDARGQGVANALLAGAVTQAFRRGVPYVMLTSRPELRPMYEAFGFVAIEPPPAAGA